MHLASQDLTVFQTPLGLLCLTSMPMEYTNSLVEFQNSMSFVLQDEISDKANIFIDNCGIQGPLTIYSDKKGNPQVLSENLEI